MTGSEHLADCQTMVNTQLLTRGLTDPAVLAAMRVVPRHRFVPLAMQDRAYDDGPLPIGEGQTISQPYIVALMAACAKLTSTSRVLEIGTGSGYSAAVLAQIAVVVDTVERIAALAERAKKTLEELGYSHNIRCHQGDGSLGWQENAPYDAIVVTAGAPVVPKTLQQQLAVGGMLVIPVGTDTQQHLLQICRLSATEYSERIVEAVRFVPLIGKEAW
jgi:protein-L-isoaspartate(D-aspartate) O-methyltransferase